MAERKSLDELRKEVEGEDEVVRQPTTQVIERPPTPTPTPTPSIEQPVTPPLTERGEIIPRRGLPQGIEPFTVVEGEGTPQERIRTLTIDKQNIVYEWNAERQGNVPIAQYDPTTDTFGEVPLTLLEKIFMKGVIEPTAKVLGVGAEVLGAIAPVIERVVAPVSAIGQMILSPSITEETKAQIIPNYGELRTDLDAGRITRRAYNTEIRKHNIPLLKEMMPGGILHEEYRRKPIWQQLLAELPAWASLVGVSATALRASLVSLAGRSGARAVVPKIARGVLKPVELVETAPAKLIQKLKPKPLIRPEPARIVPPTAKPPTTKPVIQPPKRPLFEDKVPVVATETVARRQVIVDTEKMIGKLTTLFLERKPARAAIEIIKGQIRGGQAKKLRAVADTAKDIDELVARSISKLRGKFAEPPIFEPIPRSVLTVRERGLLVNHIKNFPYEQLGQHPDFGPLNMGKTLQKIMRGGVPTKGEFKNLESVFGFDFASAVRRLGTKEKAWRLFMDITGLPKALKATADLSYTLRQVLFAGLAHPKTWGKNFSGQVKAFFSQEVFDDAMLSIKSHPQFDHAIKVGRLSFTEIGKTLKVAEEAYPTGLAAKIPILKQSNRAATYISNKMRFDVYFDYRAKFANMYDDPAWRALGDILNAATGRGVVPTNLIPAFTILNRVFFSPRFALTPAQLIYYPAKNINNPLVRRFATRSWLGFIGLNTSLLGLGNIAGLWDVELDTTNSNALRVRIGDVRFDLWHGYLPWVRLISRLVTGTTNTQTGEIKEINRADMTVHTIRGKLDPITAAIWDLLEGRTYIGEEFPPKQEDLDRALKDRLLPMAVMDVWDSYASDGIQGAIVGGTGALLGANVAAYPAKIFDEWGDYVAGATGKEWTYDELQAIRPNYNKAEDGWIDLNDIPTGRAKRAYLEEHPAVEASRYVWGAAGTLTTPEAVKIAYEQIDALGLPRMIYPIKEFKPYDASGKKPEAVLGEYINLMPKYIADYVQQFEDVYLEADLPYLVEQIETFKRRDDSLIHQYNNLTMGQEDATKAATLRANPEIDMARNFKGLTKTIHSAEALQLLASRFEALGLPLALSPTYQRSLEEAEEERARAEREKLIQENRLRAAGIQ